MLDVYAKVNIEPTQVLEDSKDTPKKFLFTMFLKWWKFHFFLGICSKNKRLQHKMRMCQKTKIYRFKLVKCEFR